MSKELEEIESILYEALSRVDAEEREAYLETTCGTNIQLRAEIDSLLLAYADEKGLLKAPSDLQEEPINILTEAPGMLIGRYKLLEKIGEGGMAVVYMAEQQEPIRRKVALKIIKLGMDTRQVIARFEAERQALAMMDHPNIAKVLDAGATETGRPYFVMELVTGVSITEYCDKNRICINERLELFSSVCNAVKHAHQRGIIHRDIKPSNIMVTLHDGKPVPKVIDFGIAKAINQRLTEKTLFTRYAHMVGTPAYMSPEQAEMSGLGVDTRTDIYSLGVLLYELLTGTTPFDSEELHRASLSEMQKIICEREPTKPSTKLSTLKESLKEISEYRRTSPDSLSGLVRGDLDWIVMKCLEKDRDRRYETVHVLMEDIERHLRNEPVLARSPTLIYRTQKFWQRHRSHIVVAIVGSFLLSSLVIMVLMYLQSSNLQWAKAEALPQVVEFVKQGDYRTAFPLAQKVRKYIPEDPTLLELWPRICKGYSITTTPAEAKIWCREYSAMDDAWQYLGQSPLENITLPQCMYRWKIEKDGFVTHECVVNDSFDVQMREEGLAGEMVWIQGGTFSVQTDSSAQTTNISASPYMIDRHEVTNEQFKEFVDRGGYSGEEYWQGLKFVRDGNELNWADAVAYFRDSTGQLGPSTWKEGTYPQGQGKHPVSGVSWFEAIAYARFLGKSLPTLYHWEHSACLGESIVIVPYSNFALEGAAPAGSHLGMGHTGLYDMAGNVKEWCWNSTDVSGSYRYILGGGWGEQMYMFVVRDFRSPWDRTSVAGFRCVQYPHGEESVADVLLNPVPRDPETRDYSRVAPCSDAEYGVILRQFDCDRTPLNAVVESIDGSSPFWQRREKITFDAAYGGEKVIAYLYVPHSVKPPYQAVVYWPGSSAVGSKSFQGLPERHSTELIINSGRALLFPVYKGTYERSFAEVPSLNVVPQKFNDWIIHDCKDLRRSIDYLETRDDIDREKIAYSGMSAGATMGPMVLAVEDRFKAAILIVGGFPTWDEVAQVPAVDPVNHARRVRTPVLMINGEIDFVFPLETSQRPMYQFLGTPEPHKEHRVYPGGHGLLGLYRKQIQADVSGWLDRYLGPVE